MKRQAFISLLSIAMLGACVAVASPVAAAPEGVHPDIVNGEQPAPGDFPFLASVFIPSTPAGDYGFFCGGSFVSPTKVITAAHCFFDEDGNRLSTALVGPASGSTMPDFSERVSSASVVVNPSYDRESQKNDIAVVTLSQPADGVSVVALPTKAQAAALTQGGAAVRSAGWGRTSSGGEGVQDFLVARLTAIPDSVCRSSTGTYKVGSVTYHGLGGGFVPSMMICAGGATSDGLAVDTCQGDSGGPLTSGSGAATLLVGVVSWGYGCAGFDDGQPITLTPGVYTRLSTYLDWLATQGIGGQSASVPGTPTGLTAQATSSSSARLTWKAPTDTGQGAITGYAIEGRIDGGDWAALVTTEGTATSANISDLTSDVSYEFRVAATNAAGTGAFSQPSAPITLSSTSASVPGQVSGFTKGRFMKVGRTYRVTVNWKAPADDGGSPITGYAARIGQAGVWSDWTPLSKPSTLLTSLARGQTYALEVVAVNAVGMGATASVSVVTPRR